MKNLIISIALLVLVAPCAFSAPNYDPNHKCTTYDVSYNVALRNKLEADFDKKYIVERTKNSTTYSYPTDAYYREVLQPYYRQQKPMEELPIIQE